MKLNRNWKTINTRTKAIVGIAFGYILSVNIPSVKEKVIPLLANHPHWSTNIGALLVIVGALQNPLVQSALGIQTHKTVQETPDGKEVVTETSKVVPIDPSTTVEGSMTTTVNTPNT